MQGEVSKIGAIKPVAIVFAAGCQNTKARRDAGPSVLAAVTVSVGAAAACFFHVLLLLALLADKRLAGEADFVPFDREDLH